MRYLLPYAYARSHQMLLGQESDHLTLWLSSRSDRQALSEVLRQHGQGDIRPELHHLPEQELSQRISSAYAQGESSAAAVVSKVQSDVDLSRMMQELPAVEDLLEIADDAHPGRARGCQRHPHRAL
jgi:general secretion pathway protein E